jgi:hypothetical protein
MIEKNIQFNFNAARAARRFKMVLKYLAIEKANVQEKDIFSQDGIKFFVFKRPDGKYSAVETVSGHAIAIGKDKADVINHAKELVFLDHKAEILAIIDAFAKLKMPPVNK